MALIGHWHGTGMALTRHWHGTEVALIGHWHGLMTGTGMALHEHSHATTITILSTALAAALLLLPLRPIICVVAAKTEPCSRHSTCGPQPHMSKKSPPLSSCVGIALTQKILARLCHDLTPSASMDHLSVLRLSH